MTLPVEEAAAPDLVRAQSNGPDRPKRIANLAAMATNVLRPKDNQSHTVRYIAQVDLDGWMVKRLKVGARTNWFVVLESTILSIYKNKSGPPKYKVNVRTNPVSVDVARLELHVYVAGNAGTKDRLLRLHIPTEADALRWKHALESAVNSDITDYYSFGKTLGSGAYGDVVQAFDTRTNEVRAVKIVQRGNNMKSREHLESEIQVMKSISHPNIVKTYQIFDLKRTIYIVMEYVPGGDLFDFVAQHDCLTEAQGSQTIRAIFQAVEYLHRHSIVHRDLKPENILCANQSWPLQIKVTDFGFSSFMDPSGDSDTMRTQVGTAYFMAPEIISNKGHGPAVDCWACGVILYTILTGRLPFPGKNTTEYFSNVVKGRPLFPNILWKGISEDAMSLVKGLLNVDPNKRLTSLGALQHRWIAQPDAYGNKIRRDRSNLHSRRRRLFKARKAVIAVAMANKFKATIPHVVDKVGDGTKKVAEGIGNGVKKTADGIGEGLKKTGTGVKKVSDNIGEGTKRVAEGVGEGTKKVAAGVAGGTKKVADSIGTGVKKTADGVEKGARKVGEGVKKTGDGIGTGLKKTADGIETGFKKTGEGFKKTGEGIKRTVEKVRTDRDRSRTTGEAESTNLAGGSQTDSTRESGRRRMMFRRRGQGSSSAVSGSEPSRQGDVPLAGPADAPPTSVPNPVPEATPSKSLKSLELPKPMEDIPAADDGSVLATTDTQTRSTSSEYFSAIEEHSQTSETSDQIQAQTEGESIQNAKATTTSEQTDRRIPAIDVTVNITTVQNDEQQDAERGQNDTSGGENDSLSHKSSYGLGKARPKLPPLSGLTMGLSDSSRDGFLDPNDSSGGGEPDSLRKTAALLLACDSPDRLIESECTNTSER